MEAISAKPQWVHNNMVVNKSPMTAENRKFVVKRVTKDDEKDIVKFLRTFFFRDEPLNLAVGLLDEETPTCVELERFCVEPIPDGVSLKAVSNTGQIMGVCINGIMNRSDEDEEIECANPKFKKIQNLLDMVYEKTDIFKNYPEVDKILDIKVASVDVAFRGQGIAKALFDETKRIAHEQDFKLVKVDCTSEFTALAVERLGFELIISLDYADYKDENGKVIFLTEKPHTAVKTFVYKIEKSS